MKHNIRIIAGPCQHESYEKSFDICKQLYYMCKDFNIDFVFKEIYSMNKYIKKEEIKNRNLKLTFYELKI